MIPFSEKQSVRRACKKILIGHKTGSAAAELARVAAWCAEHDLDRDVYGQGDLIDQFESKVASVLGKEAAVFMPSGTMAQQIALRIHADTAGVRTVGLHATSHLELHEQRGYAHLHGLAATIVGDRLRAITAEDLGAAPMAALICELPLREIGGVLPSWEELSELSATCRERGIALHMDGARLWECQPFYQKSYAAIAAFFDSVYVSCYKGLGGLAGALLAGPAPFISEARIWLRRHGGNLVQMHPFVASAAMDFDRRLAQFPALARRAKELAAVARRCGATVAPVEPQVNMFHLYLRGTPDELDARHLAHARAHGVWLTGRFSPAPLPGYASFEAYIGDNALELTDEELAAALHALT
jgi:threonine aldolase